MVPPFFNQIDRILSRAPTFALFVFPAGDDGRWLALLTISAQHASIVEQELTDERGRTRMRKYFETPQSLFPASSGGTAIQALQALDALLAEIPDATISTWAGQVLAAYGQMRALRGRTTVELPPFPSTEASALPANSSSPLRSTRRLR